LVADPIPRKCPVPRTRPPKSFQQPALSWDKFAFGNFSRRASRKCPACPVPPGILPPNRKKDPHHRRGRNFCPRRGSYPHRKDFDLSLGPHRRQGTRYLATHRWAGAHPDLLPQNDHYSILRAISKSAEPEFPCACKQLRKFSAPRRSARVASSPDLLPRGMPGPTLCVRTSGNSMRSRSPRSRFGLVCRMHQPDA
jgi:hypothetical protein